MYVKDAFEELKAAGRPVLLGLVKSKEVKFINSPPSIDSPIPKLALLFPATFVGGLVLPDPATRLGSSSCH